MLNAHYTKTIAKMKAAGFELEMIKEVEAKLAEIHKTLRHLFIEFSLTKNE